VTRSTGLSGDVTTGDTSGIERVERELTPAEALWWDADPFSLAVNYLMSKHCSARTA
jgi:hypothetical protein